MGLWKNYIKKHLIIDGLIILGIGIILMTIFNDNFLDFIGFFLFFGGVVWVVIIMLRELIKKGKFFGVFQPIFENREY